MSTNLFLRGCDSLIVKGLGSFLSQIVNVQVLLSAFGTCEKRHALERFLKLVSVRQGDSPLLVLLLPIKLYMLLHLLLSGKVVLPQSVKDAVFLFLNSFFLVSLRLNRVICFADGGRTFAFWKV